MMSKNYERTGSSMYIGETVKQLENSRVKVLLIENKQCVEIRYINKYLQILRYINNRLVFVHKQVMLVTAVITSA